MLIEAPAYLAGGFVKKGFVDHTAYTTTSFLRTIELILGLPPMSQYDAPATPVWRSMNNTADHPPYRVKPISIDLNLKNIAENEWQRKSEKLDFTKEDMANDSEFTEIIWRGVKGLDSPCPPAVRAAFFCGNKGKVILRAGKKLLPDNYFGPYVLLKSIMKAEGKFILLEAEEFKPWLKKLSVTRKIKLIQHHHTWSPDYSLFSNENHFDLCRSI